MKVRTAIAKELTVGPMRFRDVSFVVIPSQDLGGILGIPVLLALERIRWSNDGKWELGGPSDRNDSDAANLVFFENHLLLAARMSKTRVFGPVTLRPAHVTLQRTAAMGGTCCIGNIGRDVLLATGRLVLDFSTMTLKLH